MQSGKAIFSVLLHGLLVMRACFMIAIGDVSTNQAEIEVRSSGLDVLGELVKDVGVEVEIGEDDDVERLCL